ncbi:MAG: leukotoxin LktA family filamentous adhesin, partial [Phascolarctobacterium sp.]
MGTKRKALRYGMRKQDFSEIKRRDGIATSMKLLRSVLAVGFAMTPWLGSEAFAAGIERIDGINLPDGLSKTYLQGDKDTVAHIYAEQANDTVGLNRFKTFDVGANQIANLYFHTSANAPAFNTLVNTVQEQINISGTVNALRNNKIGGNLYFLSPKGMVVGSKGVINAGSLTVMTSTQGFNDDLTAANAAEKLAGTIPMDNDGSITIHGQINAMTGIDLRAAHIALQKDSKGEGTPLLQTGVVFNNIVNNNVFERADVRTDVKLAVTKDSEGNVTFAYSPNTSNETLDLNEATGDGSIKLQAEATQRNRCFNIFTVDPNNPDANWTDKDTVEAKVDLGARSTVASAGDVTITATATRQNDNNPIEFWDILTYTNAEINVDGNVSGQNVAVSAKATSSFTGSNNASTLYVVDNRTTQIINNNNNEKIDVDINNSLTDAIMNKLLEKQILGEKTKYLQTATNIIQSLYMPFSFVDAKASVNQSVDSVIQSTGNLKINAESSATNKLTAAIQHKVTTGSNPISMPIGGGFVYVQTGSEATVNLNGKAQAGGNLTVDARSTNTSVSSMALKKVKNIDTGDEATGGTGVDYCGVALAINFQDNNAVVNLGNESLADKGSVEAPRIKADGNLKVNATTTDTVSSTALVATSSDSIVNTTINVIDSDGKAEINSHVPVKGSSVSMGSTELLNSLKATTDGSSGVELTGINYLTSTAKVKQGVEKTLRPLLTFIEEVNRYSAGENINLETDAKPASGNKPAKTSSWRNYFSIGASVMVANVDNIATINIKPGASITSTTGDLSLASRVTIGDSLLITKNLLANEKKNSKVGVSSAIAVEDMHNTAEVNVESSEDEQTTLQAAGSVKATAEADQSYNRLEKMVEALEKGWAAADAYWTKPNGMDSAQDVIQKVEAAVADLLTITAKDSATNLAQSKQHTAKAKAAVDLLAQLAGVDQLKTALEAFCDAANYTNMYVSSSTDKMDTPVAGDSTAMATGTVGIQNVDNNAAVKIGPKAIITAGNEKLVQLEANAVEQSFMMAGKWAFLPDIYTTDAGSYGIGGTVGVQNASSNSLVQVMDGVQIKGGAIDLATQNDVLNMALVMGGSHTSSLGITGMVSYQGGNSTAQTLVDDDASLTALQKKVALATADGSSSKEYKGVKLSADNNTIVIGIAGDLSSSNAISMGVSTSVIDYNVKSLAVMENQEDKDTEGEGLIKASDVSVEAHTGGVINSLSVAGSKNDTSNTNKQGGGVSAATSGGQGAEGVEKIEAKASDKTDTPAKTDTTVKATDGNTTPTPAEKTPTEATKNPVVELKAAGSVSVNYIVDETRAGIDSVKIAMQRLASGDMTTNLSIQAQDDSYIGAYSGAGALSKQGVDYQNNSKFSGMINGAVAFNEINKTTSASLKNSKLTNVDNVLNQSQNSGAQVALGLALGVDLAQRMDNASVNLGASGSFNFVNSTVQAVMEKDEILGASDGSLNVHNTAYDKDVQVAGGASAEYAGSAALGASVAVNEATNKIVARMQKTSIGGQNALAGSVNNLAVSNLVQVGGAISVGVTTSKSYAVGDVAVATNVLANEVQAEAKGVTIYAKSFNNEARDGKLNQSEEANAYLAEINSVPNTAIQVDATGQYYVLGTDNTKQYLNPQGSIHIYEEDGSKVDIFSLEGGVKYDEETGALKDKDGKVIILNPNRYFTYANSDQKVDFYAPVTENIIDLNANAALANANGVVNEN